MEENRPYNFVTLDTVTKLEEWCEASATRKYKKSPQGKNFRGPTVIELEYGLGYALVRNEFLDYMAKIKNLAETVIFIAHVKDSVIEKGGSEVSVKDVNLTGKLKSITASDVDSIGYIYIDPENSKKRRITFFTNDEVIAGNRAPHLEGQDFVISEKREDGSIVTYWDKIFKSLSQNEQEQKPKEVTHV